jgi:hypothetical protein
VRAPRPALIALVGCLLLVGFAAMRLLDAGAPVTSGETPASSGTPIPAEAPSPDRTEGSRADTVPRFTIPSDAAPGVAPDPQQLRIPSLGVDAPLDPVGVEPSTGEMEIPEDVTAVGWYRYGPAPGEPGSAVLAGHVDSRRQGLGVLHRLREVEVGAPIEIVDADGNRTRWEVTALRQLPKAELPTEELFRREGQPTLAIVTCGGSFDPALGRYADNVIAYAVLDPASGR